MNKRFTYLILLTVLVLSLAACSSSENLALTSPVEDEAVAGQTESTETVASVETDSAEAADTEDADQAPAEDEELASSDIAYTLVETGQGFCYNSDGENIDCPAEGEAFYDQDAQFTGASFDYTDNGDGTVMDNVTGLIWQQTPDSGNYSWDEAQVYCESLSLGGSDDWRMPSLKELFSISIFILPSASSTVRYIVFTPSTPLVRTTGVPASV